MRAATLGALLLLGACRPRVQASVEPPPLRPTVTASAAIVTSVAPAPYPGRPSSTRAAFLKEPPYPVPKGVAHVVAHVPERLDDREKLHLVLFFHGAVQCAAQLAQLGEVICKPGEAPLGGYGYAARHDDAGTQSLFAVPQFAYFGGGSAGRMVEKGYFTGFVRELVTETFAEGLGGPRTLDDVADITLIAHSAGFNPVVSILSRAELSAKVKNVVLLDAFFAGGEDYYLQWFAKRTADSPRRFVALHGDTGDSNGHHANMAARLRATKADVVVYPKGSVVEAMRGHEATIAKMPVNHYWMPTMLLAKVVAGLELPLRATPPAEVVARPRKPAGLLLGAGVEGALTLEDPGLSNGAVADEYTLSLSAGVAVVVTVKGGPSLTETCCTVDVATQLFDGDRLIASDDDGGGAFDSRLAFVAPKTGTYRLRVTTSGSGTKLGPYVLTTQ